MNKKKQKNFFMRGHGRCRGHSLRPSINKSFCAAFFKKRPLSPLCFRLIGKSRLNMPHDEFNMRRSHSKGLSEADRMLWAAYSQTLTRLMPGRTRLPLPPEAPGRGRRRNQSPPRRSRRRRSRSIRRSAPPSPRPGWTRQPGRNSPLVKSAPPGGWICTVIPPRGRITRSFISSSKPMPSRNAASKSSPARAKSSPTSYRTG